MATKIAIQAVIVDKETFDSHTKIGTRAYKYGDKFILLHTNSTFKIEELKVADGKLNFIGKWIHKQRMDDVKYKIYKVIETPVEGVDMNKVIYMEVV